jgi:hypothetical protein
MQSRDGRDAERVVNRALAVTDRLPRRALRVDQGRAIMGVLDERLAARLKERIMEDKRRFEPRWMREMRHEMFGDHEAEWLAQGEAKGKRDALLSMLKGRGLPMTQAQRAAIRACADLAELDRWIAASGKVASVQELLAPPPRKNGARNGAAARPRGARAA